MTAAPPADPPDGGEAAASPWDARRELAMALLAVASLLIGVAALSDPDAQAPEPLVVADVFIALAFLGDWLYRVGRSPRPGRYALHHLWEAVTFVPFTLIPAVQGASAVRAVRLARLLRLLRATPALRLGIVAVRLSRWSGYARRVLRSAHIAGLLAAGAVVQLAGAVALFAVEVGPNPRAHTFLDALWWSLSLFSTVGYAVPEPVTGPGLAISAVLIVSGVAWVGLFTASLAGALLTEPGPGQGAEGGRERR